MTACICRPRDPEGWYREDCPTHGREAEEQRRDDEMRSRIYGWLSDRTSRADGSEWEHGALRIAVDELLGLVK